MSPLIDCNLHRDSPRSLDSTTSAEVVMSSTNLFGVCCAESSSCCVYQVKSLR